MQTLPGNREASFSNGGTTSAALTTARMQERAIGLVLLLDLIFLTPVVAVAWFANSALLLSDAFDYLNCIAFNLISYIILRRIRLGRTAHYEYGADKHEVIGGLISSCLMLVSAIGMVWWTVGRLFRQEPLETMFSYVGVAFQCVCLGLSVWLWRRNRRIAQATSGPIMEAAWRGNRADAIQCASVIVALALTLWLRPYAWSIYIDPVCALIALIYPTGSILAHLRRSLGDLMDKTLEEELQFKILRRLARHFHQYDAFHRIKSRRAGRRVFIDIYLGFDGERRISEVTGLIDQIRVGLAEDIPGAEVNVIVSRADLEKAPAAAKS